MPGSDRKSSFAMRAKRDAIPAASASKDDFTIGQGSAETWVKEIEAWKNLGATHLTVNTMKAGLTTPAAHIEAIRRFKEATG